MTRKALLRRVGILCCHCIRNLAFYRAGWRAGKPLFQGEFMNTTNSNFLDVCVLEWCKLFGDKRGTHYWGKTIADQPIFFAGLLKSIDLTAAEFDAYIVEMRVYRDKFVAHLDTEDVMHIPRLRVARRSVIFLYTYLLANEQVANCFHDAPENGSSYYIQSLRQGVRGYRSSTPGMVNG